MSDWSLIWVQRTKIYELAMMDDEDLEALEEGGTLAGKSLDDIQRMSPTELRKILRAERDERRNDASTYSRRPQEKEDMIPEPGTGRIAAEIDAFWAEEGRLRDRINYILERLMELEPSDVKNLSEVGWMQKLPSGDWQFTPAFAGLMRMIQRSIMTVMENVNRFIIEYLQEES